MDKKCPRWRNGEEIWMWKDGVWRVVYWCYTVEETVQEDFE